MKVKENKKVFHSTTLLLALCWIVYTCSYLGKLGYNANITQIEGAYGVSHSTAGVVSTFFFFAYGVGQVFNGIFCKKYNLRLVVFGSLLVSGLMNLLVGIVNSFTYIKFFWLLNGAALSVLWPSLIRLLSETLDKKDIGRAVVVMGTTVATGTFFVYGLSALFVSLNVYKAMFILAGLLLPSIAGLWMISYPKLVKKQTEASVEATQVQAQKTQKASKTAKGGKARLGWLWMPIIALAFFAVVDNLVKDGLTAWVPVILKEQYKLPDSISILLTMLLPILAIFGTAVAVTLRKKIKDFVMLCSVLFWVSLLSIGVVIVCLPTGWFIVTLVGFGVVSCLMAGVNNIITSMAPLYWKEKVNSGLLAGILNGFCYMGSTLSMYGLGLVADMGGWNAVFWLLFSLCAAAVAVAIVCSAINIIRGMKRRKVK